MNNHSSYEALKTEMRDIMLRNATVGDEREVFEVVEKVLEQYGLKTNPEETDKDLTNIKKYYIENGGCFKVLDNNSRIIGSYGFFPISNKTCELRKMYLLPEYQGKSLGRMMMDDALSVARDKGFVEIVLETNSLLKKATSLYRKYSFKEYKPEHLSDRCDFAMKKEL